MAEAAPTRLPIAAKRAAATKAAARRAPGERFVEPLVFVGGLCSIGVEIAASRLVAPYFGSSTFIWANLIGLTLTFLAIGYYVGGRIADRWPDPALLFSVAAVAGLATSFAPVMSRPIMRTSLDAFDDRDV